jgi:hypothetical protein
LGEDNLAYLPENRKKDQPKIADEMRIRIRYNEHLCLNLFRRFDNAMKAIFTRVFLLCLIFALGGSFLSASAAVEQTASPSPPAENPFFKPYQTPFNVPPFHLIKNEHFLPAIEEGIKREDAEVEAIVNNPKPPTFENTIAALDHTGIFLQEVASVFFSLQSAHTNKELQALARKTAPMLAAHADNISLNEKLFHRVKAVYDQRENLKLDREQLFLLENAYLTNCWPTRPVHPITPVLSLFIP